MIFYIIIISILLSTIVTLFGKFLNYKRNLLLQSNKKRDTNYFISIIIPTYNEENVIENNIKSILKNDYKNYEIIVIDDNSTDNTKKIVKKFVDKYDNIRLFVKRGAKGKPQSLNEAYGKAKGDIILFLDADSILEKKYLESHISLFNNNKINMIFTDFTAYNYKNNFINEMQDIYFEFVRNILYSNLFSKMIFMGTGIFIRKEILDKVMPIRSDSLVDDFHMALKLSDLKIKEYFILEPKVKMQYVSSFSDLWNQHTRWYLGGYKEIYNYIKRGNLKVISTFVFILFLILSPVFSLTIDLMYETSLLKNIFIPVLFSAWSMGFVSAISRERNKSFGQILLSIVYIPVGIILEIMIAIYSLYMSFKKR